MGNALGTFGKYVLRKSRRFNIENRTERFLDKNVKVVPPRPDATLREIAKIQRDHPDVMNEIRNPNSQLLDRLKNVYVSSYDPPPDKIPQASNPNRPLPAARASEPEEFGYVEPISVTPGRITLRLALQLLTKHQSDPKENTQEKLALEYNMSQEDIVDITDHFKLYTLVQLEGETWKKNLADPTSKIPFNVMTHRKYLKKDSEKTPKELLAETKHIDKDQPSKLENKERTEKPK